MISTEKSTQAAVMQYLDIRGIFHYRNNSGAMRAAHGGYIRFGAKGSPDIVAVLKGQYIGLEIKDIKGKQSDSQKEFQTALENAGGVYMLVRDVDEVIHIFESMLVLKDK